MPGIDRIKSITVAVRDQDEALRWFTEKPGFVKRVDMPAPTGDPTAGMRFLSVSPRNQPELQLILAPWFPKHVGTNATIVVHTDDCRATCDELRARGVVFTEPPDDRPFGLQAVFTDLYGNSYALLQPGAGHRE